MLQCSLMLELIDSNTGSIVKEVPFNGGDSVRLKQLLGIDIDRPGIAYHLDSSALSAIESAYELQLQNDENVKFGVLRKRAAWDDLPYAIHTNRELRLMLAGRKPLAVFNKFTGDDDFASNEYEKYFSPHVENGTIVRHAIDETKPRDSTPSVQYDMYALPGEEWRFKAYLLLKDVADKSGWNEALERMEGSLLGYTDAQNDAYIRMMYRKQEK